jgi:beta-glucosidase
MERLTGSESAGTRRFPKGFLWGTGTSSYQVEGGVAEDGRGLSIWDVFSHRHGSTYRGDTGDVACDSYHRFDQDLKLIRELGIGAYRFSVSWPRIQPDGRGPVNRRGLDYYRRMVAGLREAGVMPVLTIYHWDLPQALEQTGGWAARETAERLGELAAILGAELGSDVGAWITINEPQQSAHQGYRIGTHAPGRRDLAAAAAATHHLMLGHARALGALRASIPAGVPVGTTLDPQPYIPLDGESELAAAVMDADFNRMYLDPLCGRGYPDLARAEMLPDERLIAEGDMEAISAPIDFLGINYYRPHHLRRGDWNDLRLGEAPLPGFEGVVEYFDPEQPCTTMGWPIVPEGLTELLLNVHRQTGGVPLYITENGCAADDYPTSGGLVEDGDRIEYLRAHLAAALAAIDAGVDLRGYFYWSLMDNFEWALGYRYRFGLFYVDFATQVRTPKRSASWYAQVARTGCLPPAGAEARSGVAVASSVDGSVCRQG